MEIAGIKFGKTKNVENNSVKTNAYLLNEPIKDTFEKTSDKEKNMSADEASSEFKRISRERGNRFNLSEEMNFKNLYETGKIDIPTVTKLVDVTDFNLKSMSDVYVMGQDIKDDKFADKVAENAKKIQKDEKINRFERSVFEPEKEYSLANGKELQKGIDIYNDSVVFDAKTNEVVGKSHKVFVPEYGECYIKTNSEDYRNNLKSYKTEKIDTKLGCPYTSEEVVEHYKKDGKLLRKDILTESSSIKGMYDLKYVFPDGKERDVVKTSVDKKTGIKTIKKDMRSANGTKTEYLYEDDPKGNRIVDYKITDTNGKVLLKNSQSFEVVSDNEFISSKNGMKYVITTSENGINVKDLHHETETSIEFKKKVKGNKDEIVNLLKKVPGEELFEVVDTIKKIKGKDHDKLLNSAYNTITKNVDMADNLFVFLHELGHAKDNETTKVKDILKLEDTGIYLKDKNIQQKYLKEREKFNENFPQAQREHVEYFTQALGHYGGQWGGLSEVIAETNALRNTYTDKDIKILGTRTHYLQQYFPETIAEINKAMEYKNDIAAIEYYGT